MTLSRGVASSVRGAESAALLRPREREALEAWRRWGISVDDEQLRRALAKVPVQLPLQR